MWSYQPDLDERTPEILLANSINVVPTAKGGLRGVYGFDSTNHGSSYPDVSDYIFSAGYVIRDDGITDRLIAGGDTKLHEANQVAAFAWTDVSRGGGYSGIKQWLFDIYGGHALAAASVGTLTEIQGSNGTVGTGFSNLTNAPKARIIVVQDNALYAFDYDSGGGEVYDGWIRSDTGVITAWTPNTGECVSGRFTETPGSITAAIKQGNGVVVFKSSGMWRGQYVGLPEVVRWELVAPDIGCLGPKAVVNIADVIYFADTNGFWRYDGSRPELVSAHLRSYWFDVVEEVGGLYSASLVQIGVDEVKNIISIYHQFPAAGTSGVDVHLPFNYITGAWGPPCAHFSGQNFSGTPAFVSAVLNAPRNKAAALFGGISNLFGAPSRANALRFVSDSSSSRLVNMSEVYALQSSTVMSKTFRMMLPYFGDDHRGATLTRIYPQGTSIVSGAGANTVNTYAVTVRRRAHSGAAQSSASAQVQSGVNLVDLTATGHWFIVTVTLTAHGTSGSTITHDFEWLGLEPEFSGSRPKN